MGEGLHHQQILTNEFVLKLKIMLLSIECNDYIVIISCYYHNFRCGPESCSYTSEIIQQICMECAVYTAIQ